MIAYEVARDGFLDEHIKLIRRVYGERRDVMLSALKEHFPPRSDLDSSARRPVPLGNFARWHGFASPFRIRTRKENVAFVPGDSFYSGNGYAEEGLRHFPPEFLERLTRAKCEKASAVCRWR